jgi:excisionase family DNA binding protein
MHQADELMSPKALSEYLGIPLGTIYQWRYRGLGPPVHRVGRHLRYRFSDVEGWLDTKQEASR